MKKFNQIIFIFILTLWGTAFAQSPGGVSTNLVTWYKANSLAYADNSQINNSTQPWTDLAGTAQNAIQATNAQRPIFNNDTSNVNSNQYVRFDGTNDNLTIATNTDMNNFTSDQRSLIIAFRTGANVTNTQMLYEEGDQNIGMNIYIANSLIFFAAWNTTSSGTGAPWTWKGVSATVAANTNYIGSLVLNGNTTITGQLTGYLNGALAGTATGVGRRYLIGGTNCIGQRNGNTRISTGAITSGGLFPLAGDVMEMIYYKSTALSNADRNKIESYLAIKYGITLNQTTPTDYVNSSGVVNYAASSTHSIYNNDIAGISVDTPAGLSQLQSRSVNTDDIVTMSSASAMATGESLVWGNNNDDNGTIAEISTGVPGTVTRRLDRTWRVDQTGDVGTVTLSFNLTGIVVTGTTAANFGLLVDATDADFTSGARLIAASSFAGNVVTFNNVDFTGDDYFTLATNIVQPTVTMSLTPTSIGETGGTTVATVGATLNGPWHSTVTTNFTFTGSATGGGVDYTASASSIAIAAGSVITGSFTVTAVDDALAEGVENTLIEVSSVTNGTENGTQQAILTIADDELVNNACVDTEQIFSTELTSGDVNVYSIFGTLESTSTSGSTGNYEMIIDPENQYRYLSAYTSQRITRSKLDGSSEIILWNTPGVNPFQIAIDPGRNKIYWTEWSDTANIMCANLDGTGTPVAIATAQYYPTGMQLDKASNSLYVYSGFNTPVDLKKAILDGNCGTASFTTLLNTSLPLAYNLTIDPPGNRLFFVDYNANNVVRVNTNGSGLNLTLWPASAPGDQLRDIIYNKNTNQLYWIYTNGVIQRANADGTGVVTTVVSGANAQPDSRSIDMCVDSVAPRLTSFTSSSSNGTYCPGSTITLTATYDETLAPGSTMTVVLNTGASVVLNVRSGATISGTYTVGATGSGQNTSDLSVSSISSESISDSNGNSRTNSTVPASPNNIADISNIIVDTLAPVLTQITPVTTPTTNRNPPYTFSSSQTGSITYGGTCQSVTTSAAVGNNTITLDNNGAGGQLPDGIYSGCSLTVLDTPACNSSTLNISTFRIAATIPTVTLSINNATLAENGGTAIVTATLSNVYALPVTVNLAFTGTASNGTDYSSTASIVIPALSTTGTMTITGLNDLLSEGNETVIVDISSVTNGTESGVQQVTTTILDDDSPLVNLSVNNPTISESGGAAIFTATLSNVATSTVTVTLGFSGTATIATDYSYLPATGIITITAGSLTGTLTVSSIDDPDYEVDETVVVDITSVSSNASENGVQQRTTTIQDDQVCSYDPMPVPAGLTALMTISVDGSFDPNAPYTPLSGDDFDTIVMGRNPAQQAAWRAQAVSFFLTNYGVDFTAGNTAQSGNIALYHRMYDPLYNTRLHSASGYRVSPSGGDVRVGYYAMVVIGSSATLSGSWGTASVPFGTVAEFGEYAIDIPEPCKDYDGNNETDEITETIYLAYKSSRPNLADFISYNGALFLDIPEVFEHDLTTGDGVRTYAYTSGKINGRKELRQINNNSVTTNGSIFVTVP